MFMKIATLLFEPWMFIPLILAKGIYLRHEKTVPVNTSGQYLTTISCKTALQCAIGCLATRGCELADVDSGNLYMDAAHGYDEKHMLKNYIVIPGEQTSKDIKFFMVTTESPYDQRNLVKVSMKSNSVETVTTMKGTILSITYDHETRTLLWSEDDRIMKKVLKPASSKERVSKEYSVSYLQQYEDKLFYTIPSSTSYIYTCPKSAPDKCHNILRVDAEIHHLSVDGRTMCWFRDSRILECYEIRTKEKLIHHKRRTVIEALCIVQKGDSVLLAWGEVSTRGRRVSKLIQIAVFNAHGKLISETFITVDERISGLYIEENLLFSTYFGTTKVEARRIYSNNTLSDIVFSNEYPTQFELQKEAHVLLAFE